MKYVFSLVISALAVWAGLTVFAGRRSSGPAREVSPSQGSVAVGGAPTLPAVTRRLHRPGRAPGVRVDPFDDLKLHDPWTADNLRQGVDLGLERLVRRAHASHTNDPSSCAAGLELTPTVAHVEAVSERLSISLRVRSDATLGSQAQECLRDYFAGVVEIRDDEVDGPFPITTMDLDYPMPAQLSRYLGDSPDN